MKNVLILEDNQITRNLIVEILSGVAKNLKVHAVGNIYEACKIAMTQEIELFIVDIVLDTSVPGDVSGIEFVDRIRKIASYKYVPVVILAPLEDPKFFVFNHLHCYSYLEKPVDIDTMKKVLKEALEVPVIRYEKEYAFFRKDGILYSILKSDILYIETANRKNRIVCRKEQLYVAYKSCKRFLEELDSKRFVQCNRSTIVNKKHIKAVDYVNRYIYLKESGTVLELGVSIKKRFLQELMDD